MSKNKSSNLPDSMVRFYEKLMANVCLPATCNDVFYLYDENLIKSLTEKAKEETERLMAVLKSEFGDNINFEGDTILLKIR